MAQTDMMAAAMRRGIVTTGHSMTSAVAMTSHNAVTQSTAHRMVPADIMASTSCRLVMKVTLTAMADTSHISSRDAIRCDNHNETGGEAVTMSRDVPKVIGRLENVVNVIEVRISSPIAVARTGLIEVIGECAIVDRTAMIDVQVTIA